MGFRFRSISIMPSLESGLNVPFDLGDSDIEAPPPPPPGLTPGAFPATPSLLPAPVGGHGQVTGGGDRTRWLCISDKESSLDVPAMDLVGEIESGLMITLESMPLSRLS